MWCCYLCMFSAYFIFMLFFFFKQKTAYEMRISDWSSDVCSSDLPGTARKPAFLKSASLQPSNFDGTLSHQWVVRPGPPAMSPMSLSLKESSTAFLRDRKSVV